MNNKMDVPLVTFELFEMYRLRVHLRSGDSPALPDRNSSIYTGAEIPGYADVAMRARKSMYSAGIVCANEKMGRLECVNVVGLYFSSPC